MYLLVLLVYHVHVPLLNCIVVNWWKTGFCWFRVLFFSLPFFLVSFHSRLILMAPCHHHSAPLQQKVHIAEHIKCKVTCMCFHAINGSGPFLHLLTVTHLHSVRCALLLFKFQHTRDPIILLQDAWLSLFFLTLDLTFGTQSPLISGSAQLFHFSEQC